MFAPRIWNVGAHLQKKQYLHTNSRTSKAATGTISRLCATPPLRWCWSPSWMFALVDDAPIMNFMHSLLNLLPLPQTFSLCRGVTGIAGTGNPARCSLTIRRKPADERCCFPEGMSVFLVGVGVVGGPSLAHPTYLCPFMFALRREATPQRNKRTCVRCRVGDQPDVTSPCQGMSRTPCEPALRQLQSCRHFRKWVIQLPFVNSLQL